MRRWKHALATGSHMVSQQLTDNRHNAQSQSNLTPHQRRLQFSKSEIRIYNSQNLDSLFNRFVKAVSGEHVAENQKDND
jgi:hypothetical protein